MYRALCLIVAIGGFTLIGASAHTSTHDFFKEKSAQIIVGSGPGGGFDIYARLIGRYLGKHIPGSPGIFVQNMTGAGTLIAANHLYNRAKPDGLTIGGFLGSLLRGQILGWPGIEFDARKFEYVGVPARLETICLFTKKSGITSLEKWRSAKTPAKLGGSGRGALGTDTAKVLKAALGLPIHVVAGYKSAGDTRLAAVGGEVDGWCGGWETAKAISAKAIESGDKVVVLQSMPQPRPELPGVPLAINLAKTEEARQLIQVGIHDPAAITLAYALPPGTPKERVQILRRAFMDTMKDPDFLADAKKSNLEVNPLNGDEMERIVAGLFKLSPEIVGKLREILE